MKRFAMAFAAALSIAPALAADMQFLTAPIPPEIGLHGTFTDVYAPYMILGLSNANKMIFNIRQDGVVELGEGETPKMAAEFFLANTPFQCPESKDMEYFPLVLEFHDNNKGGVGWSVQIDRRGHVSYAGLDYISPNLTEFLNVVADATKCE